MVLTLSFMKSEHNFTCFSSKQGAEVKKSVFLNQEVSLRTVYFSSESESEHLSENESERC